MKNYQSDLTIFARKFSGKFDFYFKARSIRVVCRNSKVFITYDNGSFEFVGKSRFTNIKKLMIAVYIFNLWTSCKLGEMKINK